MKEFTPIQILLAEDNEDHAFLLKRAFSSGNLKNELSIVGDGVEAIEFLTEAADDENRDLPGLVLLDVNMPRMNGFETLESIKSNPKLKHIPVAMLTSSGREQDIAKSYASGACSYIAKPVKFEDFQKLIGNFSIYWTMVAEVPKNQK